MFSFCELFLHVIFFHFSIGFFFHFSLIFKRWLLIRGIRLLSVIDAEKYLLPVVHLFLTSLLRVFTFWVFCLLAFDIKKYLYFLCSQIYLLHCCIRIFNNHSKAFLYTILEGFVFLLVYTDFYFFTLDFDAFGIYFCVWYEKWV